MAETIPSWTVQINESPSPHPSLFLITDPIWKTPDGLTWGPGVSHVPSNHLKHRAQWMSLQDLCEWYKAKKEQDDEETFFCASTHPVIATLLRRAGSEDDAFTLWECEGKVKYITVDKVAYCTELKTVRLACKPNISTYTRMKFGFGCVDKVYKDRVFLDWILDWVGGKDRSHHKAEEIAEYCSKKAQEEQKKDEVDYDKIRVLFAAHWMCLAAIAFGDPERKDDGNRLVEHWTALAAIESAQAAYALKIPFDLIRIAELTMAAR